VLGVPFALALLGRNQVIVLSALSLIGAMAATSRRWLHAGRHCRAARRAILANRAPLPGPAIAAVFLGTIILIYANPIARLFGV